MNDMGLRTIEICAGVGMLGEGLRAGLQHMGGTHRAACYLEREAYPAAVIAARCEEGSLDPAPVWSDLLTFDAATWHGAVDCIAAGFPCQDLSLAGKRAGLDGKRSGLFFDILDIADACGARLLFLENVAGIASATASVVDEAEGDLEERAAARVLGELADRGWNAEWLTLSASDVGASHGRERWFCLAWRELDNTNSHGTQWTGRTQQRPMPGCKALGDTGLQHQHLQQRHEGDEPAGAEQHLAHTLRHGRHQGRPESGGEQGRSDAAKCGGAMADPQRQCGERRGEPGDMACACSQVEGETRERQRCGTAADGGCNTVADTGRSGLQGHELRSAHEPDGRTDGRTEQESCRPTTEFHHDELFAPGPADHRWTGIIQQEPCLAPAIEPDFRGMVDGVAFAMDESRAQRLKCIGNGVVPLCAAAAFVVLARRAGIFGVKP